MSRFPDDVSYTRDHLWLRLNDGRQVRVGVTDEWTRSLGIVVHADLPPVGSEILRGDHVGQLVGPTGTEPLVSPLSGVVAAINQSVSEQPDLIRSDPYDAGWIFEVEVPEGFDRSTLALLDAASYEDLVGPGLPTDD